MNEEVKKESVPYESNELNELYSALAKAQSEMEIAKKDNVNPFFKSNYADLTAIVKASRSALTKHGLSIIQRICMENDKMLLLTRLCHASGQWMESKMAINPPKTDIQSIGSYLTYVRRYAMSSICGIVAEYEDDDAELAMQGERKPEFITAAQRNKIEELLGKLTKEDEIAMLKWAQVEKVEFISKSKFAGVLQALEAKIRNQFQAKGA